MNLLSEALSTVTPLASRSPTPSHSLAQLSAAHPPVDCEPVVPGRHALRGRGCLCSLTGRRRNCASVAPSHAAIVLSRRTSPRRHKSILDYLHSQNFNDAFDALRTESSTDYTPDPKAKYAGLLEKKWTSVIRLQKKVCSFRSLVAASAPV